MNLGLRAKSVLALLGSTALVLILALLAGWRALNAVEETLGVAFARNSTQFSKQRILAPVSRELALSQRLADSEVTRRWLLDENNIAKRDLFFAEAERYRSAFADKAYSITSARTRYYYFNDLRNSFSPLPRYTLVPGKPMDEWFFSTMKNTRDWNINVELDVRRKVTKIWFNVVVKDGARRLGNAGTELDLTSFLKLVTQSNEAGVTTMIVNRRGDIQAHPDKNLIDYASVNEKGDAHSTIYKLLAPDSQQTVRAALERAEKNPDGVAPFWVKFGSQNRLLSLSYLPELQWFVVSSVDLKAARVVDQSFWLGPLLGGIALLTLLMILLLAAVNRLLLRPVLNLTHAVQGVTQGNYTVNLPPAGNDELGQLTRAFGAMAAQVATHTDELESKVRERTGELAAANAQMAHANRQISDSIQYASLIQGALLPEKSLSGTFGEQFFVLWRPRDVVGGDFYVFHQQDDGCLLGVVDCAGHGVPGAFMTMTAHAALDAALEKIGPRDPAALLHEMDARVRQMLLAAPREVATNMDVGLAWLDFSSHSLIFSGAKLSLYWCDIEEVGELKGTRFPIGGKRTPTFENHHAPLNGRTWYLTTDGLLDQAGGEKGFGFGATRWAELLKRHAARPVGEQKAAFAQELASFQGEYAQRDDITVLGFRFES